MAVTCNDAPQITNYNCRIKDGGSRRILPEYVDEYVARRIREASG
jgi:hypothetical protein